MSKIESNFERNQQGLVISTPEMEELLKEGKITIALYPRSFTNQNPELKVGQTINLGEGGRPDMVDYNPDAKAKITSIEPAEKNSQGDAEQVKVTFELVK